MPRSPSITHVSWGRMEVAGLAPAVDTKLWPGGARAWDWTETGTHHVPGIQVADVAELLEKGARVVVLSRGMELVLQTRPETLEHLRALGIRCEVAETSEAVGGLFHSTC